MTACGDWPATDEVRAWAAEQIGVASGTPSADCRAAVLRALPDDDFVPAETLKSAAQLLTCTPGSVATGALRDHYLRSVEAPLRQSIDEFASQFFALDIDERRRRYQELQRRAAPLPALLSRLRRLEKGMQVPRRPSAGLRDEFAELCDDVCELFTLAPLASIARRQELQEKWDLDPDRWQAAASALFEFAPRVAALQEPLLERLRLGPKLREAQGRRRRERERERARAASVPSNASDSTPNPGRYGWLVIVVVIGVLRLLVSAGNSRNSTPAPPPASNFRVPDVTRQSKDKDSWLPPEWQVITKDKNSVLVPKDSGKDTANRPGEATRRLMEAIEKNKKKRRAEQGNPVGPTSPRPEGSSP